MEEAQNDKSMKKVMEIQEQFDKSLAAIDGKINAWYQRLASNNGVSMQEARRMLSEKELKEFKWNVEEYIKYAEENEISGAWVKQLENASARVHISRLEALKIEVQQEAEKLYGNSIDDIDGHIRGIYANEFYHTAYEIQKGIGVGVGMLSLDQNLVEKIVCKPWAVDGKNFSDRLWENKTKLVNSLHNSLSRMVITGEAPDRAIGEIAKQMNVSKVQAGRIVMTESAAFANAARRDCMKNLGVEEYEIIVTLDSHTCESCGDVDGEHYPIKDYLIGVTAPPFHPFCRCNTCPYFGDEFDAAGERFARDADEDVYYVPNDMIYQKWKKEFVDNTRENVIMKAAKEYGIKGKINVTPVKIDVSDFEFDADHINKERKHHVTREEAEKFIEEAKVSIERWNGRFINYYGENGSVYLDREKKIIRTAFKNGEYDERTKKFMEVVLNAGK
jgi:SPP1 gp7 family putative phage head morphogenesis protein